MKRKERGHVLLVVIVVMVVMLLAGALSLNALTLEQRAVGELRQRQELLRGAEAGVAHRIAEMATMQDPVEVLDVSRSQATSAWTGYPAPGQFTTLVSTQPRLEYRTSPVRLLRKDGLPPPGMPVGTETYIFELDAYSVPALRGRDAEASVTVGVRMWDVMPAAYGP